MDMKKIFLLLICMMLFLVSCGKEQEEEQQEAMPLQIADNSTYQGAVSNYYRAYENCDARYQMATLAPQYTEYVMESYGYKNEEEMTNALEEIVMQGYENYVASFGEGFTLFETIKEARDFTAEELTALKEEMKTGYGRDFPIAEAKELSIDVIVSAKSTTQNGTVEASEAAGRIEMTMVAAKLDDNKWYILK